jgi:C4-type Zn-finger protein
MSAITIACPACHSQNIKRVTYSNTNTDIAYQYRTSIDKGICEKCGSLWHFRSIVPHLAAKSVNPPSYQ